MFTYTEEQEWFLLKGGGGGGGGGGGVIGRRGREVANQGIRLSITIRFATHNHRQRKVTTVNSTDTILCTYQIRGQHHFRGSHAPSAPNPCVECPLHKYM